MRLGRKQDATPRRAPTGRKLAAMTDAQVERSLREHHEYLRRVQRSSPPGTADERKRTLDGVRQSVESVKRLDGERARRAADAVPERVTSTAVGARADTPSPDGTRQVPSSQMPTARLQAAHEWAVVRAQHRAKREQAWEAREREKHERAQEAREGAKAREAERRAVRAEQGLAPPEPGSWSGWDPDAADTLAAVFSDPTIWHEWAGRDPERLDRNPPLQAADLLALYAVLATLAARGTREVVLTGSASEWMPVGRLDVSARSAVKHLAANGWLTVRTGDSGRLIVGPGQMALAARAAYVERGRMPHADT
jgi:hypothetical protein